jgi:hypothetical protein
VCAALRRGFGVRPGRVPPLCATAPPRVHASRQRTCSARWQLQHGAHVASSTAGRYVDILFIFRPPPPPRRHASEPTQHAPRASVPFALRL